MQQSKGIAGDNPQGIDESTSVTRPWSETVWPPAGTQHMYVRVNMHVWISRTFMDEDTGRTSGKIATGSMDVANGRCVTVTPEEPGEGATVPHRTRKTQNCTTSFRRVTVWGRSYPRACGRGTSPRGICTLRQSHSEGSIHLTQPEPWYTCGTAIGDKTTEPPQQRVRARCQVHHCFAELRTLFMHKVCQQD